MLPLGEYFFYFHCEGNMRQGSGGAMLYTLYKLGLIYVANVLPGQITAVYRACPRLVRIVCCRRLFPRTLHPHSIFTQPRQSIT